MPLTAYGLAPTFPIANKSRWPRMNITPPEIAGDAILINATWNEGLTTEEEFSAKIAAAFTDFLDVTGAPHISAGSVSAPSITEPTVDIPSSLSVASPTVVEPDIEIPAAINIDVPTVIEPNVTIPTCFPSARRALPSPP